MRINRLQNDSTTLRTKNNFKQSFMSCFMAELGRSTIKHASSDCGTAPSQRFLLRIIMAFHAISIGLGVGLWYYISCSYAFSFLLCMYLFDHFYIQCWLLFCWMKVCFSTWCQCFYSLNIKMQLKEIISVFADVLVYCTAPQQYSKHWVMILFSRESQHCFTEVTWIIRLFLRFGLPHRLS